MNPGKIVRASRMDDRALFRFKPDYRVPEMQTALDWSAYPGAGGGFQGAVEMCNNNGECRKHVADVMCPSFRVTGNERDVTRGRANSLRLAISGQLGPDALASDEMLETMKLCVSCKGCRRECPTGVDMAKMKIEVLAAANKRRGLSLRDRLVAYLPRYAPYAARLAPLHECPQRHSRRRLAHRAPHRPLRQAPAAALAPRCFAPSPRFGEGRRGAHRARASAAPRQALHADWGEGNARGRPVRRHLQHLLRAREPARRRRGAAPAWLSRPAFAAGRRPDATARRRARCAAGARSCPPAWSRRRARRPGACLRPPRRSSSAASRSSGLEPSCLLTLRDEFLSHAAGGRDRAARLPGAPVRGVPGARSRSRPHSPADRAAARARSCCTATAIRRRSAPWVPCSSAGAGGGAESRDREVQLLRHGRRLRLWRRHPRCLPGHGRAFLAAGRAQGRARTPSSPPMASPAGIRSATAPAARRCTSRVFCAMPCTPTPDGRQGTSQSPQTSQALAVDGPAGER